MQKLYIGNTSFTMSNQSETVPHELYLRMVQPNKPGAMLKLQGSVVGKLRVERQLGYKHAKYVQRIDAVANLDGIGKGRGGYWEDNVDYDWYAGI